MTFSVMDEKDKYCSHQNLAVNFLLAYMAASGSFSGYIFRVVAPAAYQWVSLSSETLNEVPA